jgi:hypothetical protein
MLEQKLSEGDGEEKGKDEENEGAAISEVPQFKSCLSPILCQDPNASLSQQCILGISPFIDKSRLPAASLTRFCLMPQSPLLETLQSLRKCERQKSESALYGILGTRQRASNQVGVFNA